MEIFKTLTHSLAALGQPRKVPSNEVVRVEEVRVAAAEPLTDRRVRPDRRRRQEPFNGPDRRRKNSRRSPTLLHPRTREGTSLEDRRGRNVSTRA